LHTPLACELRTLDRMTKMFSRLRRMTRLAAIVPLAAIVLNASAASAQLLGSAQNFAVLGASTVTNTGATDIKGDVGVSPGTAITGFLLTNTIVGPGTVTAGLGLVNGTIRPGGMVAAQAQADAHLAYAGLKAMACPSINNLSGQVLGTAVLSLPPGVYCFDSSAQLTGTLRLTGAGPWVFQIVSTLTTAASSSVVMVDAAPNCGSNVFWQIGSSATLGAANHFVGNILALASITLGANTTTSGSVVALTAAVTMDTDTASVCSTGSVVPPPGLEKCEERHDRDHDGDHDKDHGNKDHGNKDHGDKDHGDKDHGDKDHKSMDTRWE
jgi:Ice-binding-like